MLFLALVCAQLWTAPRDATEAAASAHLDIGVLYAAHRLYIWIGIVIVFLVSFLNRLRTLPRI